MQREGCFECRYSFQGFLCLILIFLNMCIELHGWPTLENFLKGQWNAFLTNCIGVHMNRTWSPQLPIPALLSWIQQRWQPKWTLREATLDGMASSSLFLILRTHAISLIKYPELKVHIWTWSKEVDSVHILFFVHVDVCLTKTLQVETLH